MKVSENFCLQEFIDPVTWHEHGRNSIHQIDGRLIRIAQFIRREVGKPVTINNWHTGGAFKESGLRRKDSKTGSKYSQHKLGKAIDCKVNGMDGKDWCYFVVKFAADLYRLGVRRIEHHSLATTWGHFDLKEHGRPCIQVVDLKKVVEEIPIKNQ